MTPISLFRSTFVPVLVLVLTACGSGGANPETAPSLPEQPPTTERPGPTVVRPGAPGEGSDIVEVDRVSQLEMPGWTEADAEFMAGMIHHHAQALQMTALIDDRSRSRGVHQMGLRMEISQRDEIRLMQNWLEERGLEAPEVVLEPGPDQGKLMSGMGMAHGSHDLDMMPGMLTPDQMQDLREASGDEFDRLWLQYMIQHHRGAITMVAELFATPRAGQDSAVFRFASDVDADQQAEIDRMNMLLRQYR